MDRINLGDGDVAVNRDGGISEGQEAVLRRVRLVWVTGSVGIGLIVLGVVVVFILKAFNPGFASSGQLFLMAPIALFWLWLLRRCPGQWRRVNRDLRIGRVAKVSGVVHGDFEMGVGIFRSVRHFVVVGDERFRVGPETFRLFRNGERYRIYFSPFSKTFLGALALVQEREEVDTAVPAPSAVLLDPLTEREVEILQLIAAGLSNKEIAAELSLSTNTVKVYASQLYEKLGVGRRTEAVARARKIGLMGD